MCFIFVREIYQKESSMTPLLQWDRTPYNNIFSSIKKQSSVKMISQAMDPLRQWHYDRKLKQYGFIAIAPHHHHRSLYMASVAESWNSNELMKLLLNCPKRLTSSGLFLCATKQ